MRNISKTYLIPALHLIVIIFAYLTPLFIPWYFILLGFVLYRIQFLIFGGCVLTILQLGNEDEFWYHYIQKVHPNISQKYLALLTDYVMPIGLIVIAYSIQK